MALTQVPIELSSTPGIVDNSNATAITIDSSENVGVGVSSPDGTFHVHTGSAGTVAASSQADDLVIENSAEGGMTIITPDDQSARIRFTSPSTNNDVGGATIFYRQNINKMLVGTAVSGGKLALASGAGNETMTLDSSGNVLVGRTSASFGSATGLVFRPNNDSYIIADGSPALTLRRNSSNGDIMQFYRDGTQVGYISAFSGSVSYQSGSDRRLKENIADADDAGSKIDAIQVRKFDWIADGSHQDYGMIAQELQTVAPEAVGGDPDSDKMMGVDYSKLVPMLVKEIQSLRARVAQLENN